jgi:type I restriction enzyme M protein
MTQQNLAPFIWNVADLLLGAFKPSEYGRIILPFTVLRRLECVLEPTRQAVMKQYKSLEGTQVDLDLVLPSTANASFYNISEFSLGTLGSTSTRANLENYISKFSPNARQIFEHFAFDGWISKLENANLLYLVAQKFASIDMHPDVISNHEMGLVFEHLIRKFAESSNDDAGQYFTPRDVVRLVTTLVFSSDHDALNAEGVVRTVYDCAAGTGGFLSSAIEQVYEWNPNARLIPYAQELNPETYAISVADKLIQGYDTKNIKLGNTLSNDQLPHEQFDYCLANPPFGVKWENVQKAVQAEQKELGFAGRFGPGLPRVGDGSLLFLMHLLSKRKPVEQGGSRIGIVLSGSPLFNGGAGSGESEIRRWILENDWLEAIIALPGDMFYNTGINTYIWILSNHKPHSRKDTVQLINATNIYTSMRKSLGSKRKMLSEDQIAQIAREHDGATATPLSKLFHTTDFAYRRITVERPLQLCFYPHDRELIANFSNDDAFKKWPEELKEQALGSFAAIAEDEIYDRVIFEKKLDLKLTAGQFKTVQKHIGKHHDEAVLCRDKKGNVEPNPDLRDNENVPFTEDVHEYFEREVKPHVPLAWIDESVRDSKDGLIGIVGYEIPFNRHFYEYTPPRSLEAIDSELDTVTKEILDLLNEVHS